MRGTGSSPPPHRRPCETAGVRLANTKAQSGNQPGDPALAAATILEMARLETPPRHLVLGAFRIDAVTRRLKAR